MDIIEALKNNEGLSVLPKHLCEKELKNGTIKLPFLGSRPIRQKRFYSFKLKNNNLKEIIEFWEEMEVAIVGAS